MSRLAATIIVAYVVTVATVRELREYCRGNAVAICRDCRNGADSPSTNTAIYSHTAVTICRDTVSSVGSQSTGVIRGPFVFRAWLLQVSGTSDLYTNTATGQGYGPWSTDVEIPYPPVFVNNKLSAPVFIVHKYRRNKILPAHP